MEAVGTFLFAGGWLIAIVAYGYTVRLAFKYGTGKGVMTILIGPLVALFVSEIRTDPKTGKALMIWGISFVTMILGVIFISIWKA